MDDYFEEKGIQKEETKLIQSLTVLQIYYTHR